jgi:hypothetical protein
VTKEIEKMADDTKGLKNNDELARRDFVALGVAAGLAAAGTATAAGLDVVETNVDIKTPDAVPMPACCCGRTPSD